MALSQRLAKRSEETDVAGTGRDPVLDAMRVRVHEQLIQELGPYLSDVDVPIEEARRRVHEALVAAIDADRVPLPTAKRNALVKELSDDILGYGPLEPPLNDETITEIMVNGPNSVYAEREGKMVKLPSGFIDENHLRRVIDRIVAQVGRRIDESSPMVDARLLDGSRVNAVIHPLAIGGPFLTIRKFSRDPFQVDDLIGFGTLCESVVPFLQASIEGKLNVVVSGGTGTGKTTMLNVLSSFIPDGDRVVTIEDAKELQLRQDHVLCMEARPANIEGRGQITIRDLVKNALRMRPDRVVVGEVRSGEALDMLQAMNTGHDGSLTTVHSNGPRDTLSRIETMTMMAGFDLPIRAIREQMASALDLIVHISRLRDGSRRVTHVTEVQGMEGDVIVLQDIYLFDFHAGVDATTGKFRGTLQPTGNRPKFAEKFADLGIHLGAEVFEKAVPLGLVKENGRSRGGLGRR